jgi:hypothetical protein
LDEIHTKDLRVFLIAIQSHLYSFAFRFVFLQNPATSYSFYIALLYIVHVKEKGGKPERKQHPLPYGLKNPYRIPSLITLKIMPRNLKEIVPS